MNEGIRFSILKTRLVSPFPVLSRLRKLDHQKLEGKTIYVYNYITAINGTIL